MATGNQPFRDLRNRPRREPPEPAGPTGRRPRSFWWLADLRGRLGPGIVIAFLLVVVLTAGLLVFRYFYLKPDEPAVAAVPSIFDGEPTANYGRPLSPAVRLRLARYGIPLHMGPNGVPLIRERLTGDVREVTELELQHPESSDPVPSAANADVVTVPGPHGTGVMWWEPRHLQDLPEPRYVDRVRWYQHQERQLNALTVDLVLVIDYVVSTPADRWDDRWGVGLVDLTTAITDKYAFGNPDYWSFASRFISCDSALDLAMTSGIGSSCPSQSFAATVDQVYVAAGHIVGRLERVGRAAQLPYDYNIGKLYRPSEVAEYQRGALSEVERLMEDVGVLFEDLRNQGEAHGHYLDVRLP